jgi:hypothetical protein
MSARTVFLSHRRDGIGKHFARSLELSVTPKGYDVFLDVETIEAGKWETQILAEVGKRAHFVLILTPGCFDRCSDPKDWVRREFERALETGRNIVLISEQTTDLTELRKNSPEVMHKAFDYQSHRIHDTSFDKDIEILLEKYIHPSKAPAEHTPGGPPRHACRIGGMELKHTAPVLFGRGKETEILDRAWARAVADERPRTVILSFIAWGGVGKTSLISHWLEKMAGDGWPGMERVFVWSFYSQGTSERTVANSDGFLRAALTFFGDTAMAEGGKSAREKGVRVAELAGLHRTILVLDGLEPLQHPPGPQRGVLRDDGIAGLLFTLRRQSRGLCIISTREHLAELAPALGKTCEDHELEHLQPIAGAELLHSLDVRHAGAKLIAKNDPELVTASEAVRGHALSLTLLGTWLAEAHGGDIRQRDKITFSAADDETQGDHAFKILHAYETWLGTTAKGQRMLAMLRLLGFFDRAAEPALLATLLKGPVLAGITEPLVDAGPEQWRAAIADLEKLRLVSTQPPRARDVVRGYAEEKAREATKWWKRNLAHDIGQPGDFRPERIAEKNGLPALDAHPLLREYFANQLGKDAAESVKQGHGRLADHLLKSVPYWPEGEDGLQPLYQAIVHGTRAGRVQEMCEEVYRDRILRGTVFYSTKKLGLHSSDLGAVGCFFAKQWQTPSPELLPNARAWLLNEASQCLRAVGRLTEAVEPLRTGIEMLIQQENWKEAALSAGNLSELGLTLGAIADAVRDGACSIELADRSGHGLERISERTTHADTLHHAGKRDAARTLFAEAETLQEKRQLDYPLLYSVRGYQYCDLLLADAAQAGWRAQLSGPAARFSGASSPPETPEEIGSSNHGKTPDSGQSPVRQDHQDASPEGGPVVAGCVPQDAGHGGRDARALHLSLLSEVAARAMRTLGWAERHGDPLDIALDHLTLARVALYGEVLGSQPAEGTHFQSALAYVRATGDQERIPRVLLSCAWWRVRRGEGGEGRALLEEAEDISRRGGMRLQLADTLLHRALLFHGAEDIGQARKDVEEAGRIIAECGYKRREPELAMLREALSVG